MRLRPRILLLLLATTAALVGGLYLLSSRMLLRSFASLEEREMYRDVERAQQSIAVQINDLHVKSADWASWDDTYRFMADLSRPDRMVSVQTLGQSAHLGSPHYRDQTPLWLANRYHPLWMAESDVTANLESETTIRPE